MKSTNTLLQLKFIGMARIILQICSRFTLIYFYHTGLSFQSQDVRCIYKATKSENSLTNSDFVQGSSIGNIGYIQKKFVFNAPANPNPINTDHVYLKKHKSYAIKKEINKNPNHPVRNNLSNLMSYNPHKTNFIQKAATSTQRYSLHSNLYLKHVKQNLLIISPKFQILETDLFYNIKNASLKKQLDKKKLNEYCKNFIIILRKINKILKKCDSGINYFLYNKITPINMNNVLIKFFKDYKKAMNVYQSKKKHNLEEKMKFINDISYLVFDIIKYTGLDGWINAYKKNTNLIKTYINYEVETKKIIFFVYNIFKNFCEVVQDENQIKDKHGNNQLIDNDIHKKQYQTFTSQINSIFNLSMDHSEGTETFEQTYLQSEIEELLLKDVTSYIDKIAQNKIYYEETKDNLRNTLFKLFLNTDKHAKPNEVNCRIPLMKNHQISKASIYISTLNELKTKNIIEHYEIALIDLLLVKQETFLKILETGNDDNVLYTSLENNIEDKHRDEFTPCLF